MVLKGPKREEQDGMGGTYKKGNGYKSVRMEDASVRERQWVWEQLLHDYR